MNRWRQRVLTSLTSWYGGGAKPEQQTTTTNSKVFVDVYKNLAKFRRRITTSNMAELCRRTKEDTAIEGTYLENWVYSSGTVKKFHPKNVRRYFVAGTKGFAVGALLDPKQFGGQRIFYLILICTSETSRGVGTQLMRAIEKEARESLKCERIWLSAVEDRTWIYAKWGFTFGPYCPTTSDPLRAAKDISARKAPTRPKIPILNRNGARTGRVNPLPKIFYDVRGVHRDQYRIDGYLMTKCL